MKKKATLTEQLREATARSSRTLSELARDTGIDKSALSRFLNRERGVSCDAMDRLGEYLGLEIVNRKRTLRKKGKGR